MDPKRRKGSRTSRGDRVSGIADENGERIPQRREQLLEQRASWGWIVVPAGRVMPFAPRPDEPRRESENEVLVLQQDRRELIDVRQDDADGRIRRSNRSVVVREANEQADARSRVRGNATADSVQHRGRERCSGRR